MDQAYRSIPLNPLRAFAVASRHHTFTAAANYMGVSQVAISRQITTLEEYLGVKLFERNTRSVSLTDAGRLLAREVVAPFDELERATDQARVRESERTINLRIYPTLAHYWLLPRLWEFTDRYPDYQVRFDTAVKPLDFRGTHLDVAVQLGNGPWRDARNRKLFDEVVDVVCSPAYAERHNNFANATSLRHASLLHARYRLLEWSIWAEAAELELNDREGMVFDSSLLVYSAALRGVGLALGQIGLLGGELASGTLVRPFDRPVSTGLAFHVVWPTIVSVSPQTRHFIDWLHEICGLQPEFFKTTRSGVKNP